MDRLKGVRCRRELKAVGLPEFLISAIEQSGYFTGHQEAWAVPPSDGRVRQLLLCLAGLSCLRQYRPSPVFAHQELVCDPGHPLYIKPKGAESAENFVKCQ